MRFHLETNDPEVLDLVVLHGYLEATNDPEALNLIPLYWATNNPDAFDLTPLHRATNDHVEALDLTP